MNFFTKKEDTTIKPCGFRTVNPEFLDIPKDDKFIAEIMELRKSVDGELDSNLIIKDTFKERYMLTKFVN